jgi:mRNA-degrading endonuclease RelE of RelBE toxin-antitoxin system
MFEILLSATAAEELDQLNNPIHDRIQRMLERLQNWPNVSGAKALAGDLAGSYRMRTGAFRLQFHLENQTIVIDKIGHRDGFYDD